MTLRQQAATALAHAQAAGVPVPDTDTAHLRRLRAALAREVAVMLGVPPTGVVVTDDPQRSYSGFPGQLITVHDPDDSATVLRFIPETGNTGSGGGAYLLLDLCPGCSTDRQSREVPMMSIAGLADLGLYQQHARSPALGGPATDVDGARPEVPIEFFDDPGHAPHCPLR
jgi:hypothetical protein